MEIVNKFKIIYDFKDITIKKNWYVKTYFKSKKFIKTIDSLKYNSLYQL